MSTTNEEMAKEHLTPSQEPEVGANTAPRRVSGIRRILGASFLAGLGIVSLGAAAEGQTNHPVSQPTAGSMEKIPANEQQKPPESNVNPNAKIMYYDLNEHDTPHVPYFVISVENSTVINIQNDAEDSSFLWVTVKVPGEKVSKNTTEANPNDPTSFTTENITGATLRFKIKDTTSVSDDSFEGLPVKENNGVGPAAFSANVKVGEIIPQITAPVTYSPTYQTSETEQEVSANKASFDKLINEFGEEDAQTLDFTAQAVSVKVVNQ